MISRDKFFHAINNGGIPREPVELPDGETIYVRRMTLAEQQRMYGEYEDRQQAYIVLTCACYPDGEPFFMAEDLAAIEKMPADYCNPIWLAARGIKKGEEDDAKKNETQPASSS